MPELPEVETIRRDLEKKIIGQTIRRAEILFFKRVSPKNLAQKITGFKIQKVSRRAKLLVIEGSTHSLLFHLKMTGQIVLRHNTQIVFGGHPMKGVTELPNKYTRAIFYFQNGDVLYFNDLRKFGYIKLIPRKAAEDVFSKYGVEPLEKDFSLHYFLELTEKSKTTKLKAFLLNQEKISGLGNIYVDESCFLAGVRPGRRVGSLTKEEKKKLWQAIRRVLQKSIQYRGTSFNTYVDTDGKTGGFWKYRQVYGRKGELCKKCKSPIVYVKLVGRGTHYCPHCQK